MGSAFTPLKYRMVGHDAVIVMRGSGSCQLVQVTHDALADIQSPPQCDAERLTRYIDVFTTIATRKIGAREIAFDGRIWITGSDVRALRGYRTETALSEQAGL